MNKDIIFAEIDFQTAYPRFHPEISKDEVTELFRNKYSYYFKRYFNFNREFIYEGINFINGKFIVVLFDYSFDFNLIIVKDVRKAHKIEIKQFLNS